MSDGQAMIGEVLGSYRITGQLGTGGMGVVYLAEHPTLRRKAAIKMLRSELSADAEMVARFFNEARAATLIKHPGIVAIFDFGTHSSGSAYLVMEYLEGESLWAILRRERRLPVESIVAIGRQVASTLAVAHAASIVHRDLKPANLFLVADPDLPFGRRIKVLDFGIAKLTGDAATSQGLSGITARDRIMGTPAYMAPEQCRGAALVDARADVYSLGCILFQMATGRPPFESASAGELITSHVTVPPPRVASLRPDLPAALATLIDRCLAKPPELRPQKMEAIVAALDSLSGSRPPPPPDVAASEAAPPPLQAGPASVTITAHSMPQISGTAAIAPPRRKRRTWPWLALIALIAAAAAVAVAALASGR